MADSQVLARPSATSWGAVLGGWVATVGASVIFAPLVAGLIAAGGAQLGGSDLAMAVPVVLGILLSYLVGGYVAGRMAGYRTSWHGMMTAFFSLLVLMLVLLAGAAADSGVFAASGIRSLADVVPGVREWNADTLGNALSFGAILGFLAAIFGGWLGGVLAPTQELRTTRAVTPVTPASARREPAAQPVERHREVVRRGRLIPTFGRKGGEHVTEDREVTRERDVDQVHTDEVKPDRT